MRSGEGSWLQRARGRRPIAEARGADNTKPTVIGRLQLVGDNGRREAAHVRSRARRRTTVTGHMPVAHQRQAEWTPERILGWAATVGVNTRQFAERLLSERPHPEHGYRSCLGVFRLSKKYGTDRLDAACARALSVDALSYRHVATILQHGLDRAPALDIEPRGPGVTHENVRGRDYYH